MKQETCMIKCFWDIILKQNYPPDVTNNPELQEADHSSPETLIKDLSSKRKTSWENNEQFNHNVWKLFMNKTLRSQK